MSVNEQDTMAGIIAEMRESVSFNRKRPSEMEPHFRVFACGELVVTRNAVANRIENFADRVEAAHNREVEAITAKLEEARHCWKVWSDRADELKNKCNEQYAKLKSVGNAADIADASKMGWNGAKTREALCEIVKRLNSLAEDCAVDPVEIRDIALAALAEPPRNCDNAGSWLDLYKHFHAPKGMREMPPEWVDAIAAFCHWLVATPNAKGATDGSK